MSGRYDALLLVSFGGPEGQDDVIPFLRNVTAGRGIPDERLEEVAHHYRHFGGVSPINAQNRALKAALEDELARRGIDLPVYWGNRNWAPYLADAVQAAYDDGHRRLLALVTSAYSSYSSCRQYREDLARSLEVTGLAGEVHIDKVRQYFDHPGFVAPFRDGVRAALERARTALTGDDAAPAGTPGTGGTQVPGNPGGSADRAGDDVGQPAPGHDPGHDPRHDPGHDPRHDPIEADDAATGAPAQDVHVLFVTHSIPTATALSSGPPDLDLGPEGAYGAQHRAVAAAVMNGLTTPWSLVYQSRSGDPRTPWLEPDVNDAIRDLAAAGARGVVIVPLGFVSDHMEVLWDLDEEALTTARELGLWAERTPTPGIDPAFVAGLVDLVTERTQDAPRPALTDLGPWYDVCPANCCANPRGNRPALAGAVDAGGAVSDAGRPDAAVGAGTRSGARPTGSPIPPDASPAPSVAATPRTDG